MARLDRVVQDLVGLMAKEKERLLKQINNITATEGFEEDLAVAWDDITGKEVGATKSAKARKEEVDYIHKTNLYTKVPRSKAKQFGAKVISVRWININKGDNNYENCRSRLVAG